MNSGTISMRYVRALFSYALENKAEDTVFAEMKKLSESFTANPNLRTTLDNPVLNTDDKLKLVVAAAGGKVSDIFTKFIRLVLRQRRENHLQTISLSYLDTYREHKNITVGRLVTAQSMDNATVDKIKAIVQKTKPSATIELITEVDPDITGGFILYVDSFRLDASIASQLRKIKDELMNKNKKIA